MLNFANSVFKEQNDNLPPFLNEKLRKAQELIQRINPVLHQLHQRTATAVESSKQHLEMRDRAVEERDLVRHLPLKLNSVIIYSFSVPCLSNLKGTQKTVRKFF